jgi:hypothetical protein
MIKTLHITSIIVAVLAAGLFAFPVVFGFRGNKEIDNFLKAQSALAKYRQAGKTAGAGRDETSPLVTQAAKWALIIDPLPPTPDPIDNDDNRPGPETKEPGTPKPPIRPKFKVLATSYNQTRPEESLALVDEPGKGLHWVRQADIVGNLTIEVQNGSVLAKSGSRSETLAIPHKPQMSLLASEFNGSFPAVTPTPTINRTPPKGGRSGTINRKPPRQGKTGNTISAPPTRSKANTEMSEEQKAKTEKLLAELQALAASTSKKTSSTNSSDSTEPESTTGTNITDAEAGQVGELGKELGNVEPTPSDRAKQLRDRRAERSKRLRDRIEKARRNRK